jgi:hypothetical protein
MPPDRLENLVRTGDLVPEAPYEPDLQRLLASARARLSDAERTDITFDSRFDLAYNAAHALAQADKYQFQWWALGLVGGHDGLVGHRRHPRVFTTASRMM